MSDSKSLKKMLTKLKEEHWKLDKLVLHMTAQENDRSKGLSSREENMLSGFKKRKLIIRDEIAKVEKQINELYL